MSERDGGPDGERGGHEQQEQADNSQGPPSDRHREPPPGQQPQQPPRQDPPPNRPPPDQSPPNRTPQSPPPNQTAQGPPPERQLQDPPPDPPPRRAEIGQRRAGRAGRTPRSRRRRQGTVRVPGLPESADEDPVQAAFDGRVDLYDIATWEVRSSLDRLAVSVTRAIQTGRTVLLVGAAILLFLLQGAVAAVIIIEEPFIGLLAVSSMLPAVLVAGYLWYGDPSRREPFVTLAATFLLSLLFAGFAGVVNSTVQPAFGALGAVGIVVFYFAVVGPVEEFVKWLAVRVYAYRNSTFQTVVDGVVYGAAAGVGFAAIENLIYIVTIYLEAADTAGIAPTEAATNVATQRFFVGPGHVVYSAWAGFYLGLAKFNPENRAPIVVKGLLIAVFIHALYNTSITVLPSVLPGVAILGFIVLYDGFWFVLLYRKVRTYRELYRARYPGGPAGDTRQSTRRER